MEHKQHAARTRQRAEVSRPLPAALLGAPAPCGSTCHAPCGSTCHAPCGSTCHALLIADQGSCAPPQVGTITMHGRSPASASILARSLSLLAPLLPHRYLPGVDGELITGVMVPWLYVGSCLSGEACILLLVS